MRYFYGIHLQSSSLSSAFDVIRYLSEPDSIRFSHITLRGPYVRPLPQSVIRELNESRARQWRVRLDGAGGFIQGNQNTVIIKVDLMDLSDLFYKPDFADGTPHITLYDGTDRSYANALLRMLYRFDFQEHVCVSPLKKISPKAPLSGSFSLLYQDFSVAYEKFLGAQPNSDFVTSLSNEQKFSYIEKILKAHFCELYDKLKTDQILDNQFELPFDE